MKDIYVIVAVLTMMASAMFAYQSTRIDKLEHSFDGVVAEMVTHE